MIRVNLGPRSYDIAIASGVGEQFAAFVRERLRFLKALVVCDSHTESHARALADALAAVCRVIPSGEASKSLEQVAALYATLADMAADRKTPVIAVGGGVIGDLAGFAAATYNRGLPLIMVPTTLLSMVDSSVGGKVGINLPQGKNLVGSFHQPAGVWIDTDYLKTLPDREYRSGLAEVVKYGMILDAGFFAWLEANADALLDRQPAAVRHIVSESCRCKAIVVEQDEREETGLRMILNYGHTFAHAFESVAGYGTWLHGEAVSAGMVVAARLAVQRGLIEGPLAARQTALLQRLNLPIAPRTEWAIDDLIAVMRRDKKNVAGQFRLILPKKLGEVAAFDDVSETALRDVLTQSLLDS